MFPIVYSITDTDKNQKGIIFADSYADALRRLEGETDGIVDIYLTSVSGENIKLNDDMYNKLLDTGSLF